jgi:hypothetical protein
MPATRPRLDFATLPTGASPAAQKSPCGPERMVHLAPLRATLARHRPAGDPHDTFACRTRGTRKRKDASTRTQQMYRPIHTSSRHTHAAFVGLRRRLQLSARTRTAYQLSPTRTWLRAEPRRPEPCNRHSCAALRCAADSCGIDCQLRAARAAQPMVRPPRLTAQPLRVYADVATAPCSRSRPARHRKKERSTPVSRRALRGHSVNEDHRACAAHRTARRAMHRHNQTPSRHGQARIPLPLL